jgi:hypothetical protein
MTSSSENVNDAGWEAFSVWISGQTLKSVPVPGYLPEAHRTGLDTIYRQLAQDTWIASGKMGATVRAVAARPEISRQELTEAVFHGNSGYSLQVTWPLVSIFAAHMPRRIASSTAQAYAGWIDRIRRIAIDGISGEEALAVETILDLVSDAYLQAVGQHSSEGAEIVRVAEGATERLDTNQPGIYVFTTPTYLAYPPFGWNTDDISRHDFRYLKTGSTSVDVTGRIQAEIRRQTGLPEPYVVVATFRGVAPNADYLAIERSIHLILGEARHGPEEDGTRRGSARGAGTEWFITRLPLLVVIAQSLGLELSMDEEFKTKINNMFEECDLPNWLFS